MHCIRREMSENLEAYNILLSTRSFFLIKLSMFWVWGTCHPLYKLFPLHCFCGLYDLNSLSFSFFLQTQAFTLKLRSILSMLTDDLTMIIPPHFIIRSMMPLLYCVLLIVVCLERPTLGQMLPKFLHNLVWEFSNPFNYINQTLTIFFLYSYFILFFFVTAEFPPFSCDFGFV